MTRARLALLLLIDQQLRTLNVEDLSTALAQQSIGIDTAAGDDANVPVEDLTAIADYQHPIVEDDQADKAVPGASNDY